MIGESVNLTSNVSSGITEHARRGNWLPSVLILTLTTVLSVLSRWAVPVRVAPLGDHFDSGLFEAHAASIVDGQWLGGFDWLTLSKGVTFPLFAAVVSKVHLPLQVAEQSVYLAGAALIAGWVLMTMRSRWAAVFVYVVLAMDPVNFSTAAADVMRDNLYPGLVLVLVGSVGLTANFLRTRSWGLAALFSFLGGGASAAVWMCREEGVWIAPIFIIVFLLPLAAVLARRTVRSTWRPSALVAVLLVGLIGGVAFAAPLYAVMEKNRRVYGVALANDMSAGAFPQAYATWSRIRGVPLTPYVPINKAQRYIAYSVSPSARKLEPVLELPDHAWHKWGCSSIKVCDDFAGGAMVWVLRNAADTQGLFTDEQTFQRFFAALDSELRAACDTGKITCAPSLPESVQPIQTATLGGTVSSAAFWLSYLPEGRFYYGTYQPSELLPVSDEDRVTILRGVKGADTSRVDAIERLENFERFEPYYIRLGTVFGWLFAALVGGSVAFLLMCAVGRGYRGLPSAVLLFWSALAALVLTRVLLFAVVDTTQFLISPRYHYVTRSLLLAFASVGFVLFVASLLRMLGSPRENN